MTAIQQVLWWKFPLPGLGVHMLRVRNVGLADQEVLLDGTPMDAPPGTATFTGPGASLLELQQRIDGTWLLLVDGKAVEPYSPDPTPLEMLPVVWWKFSTHDSAGTHHLRVTNIGSPWQEILLDGTPLEAPEGTTTFTGPGGALLELQKRDGIWVLLVDGTVHQQCNPYADGDEQAAVWNFSLPGTGQHQLCVANLGTQRQEVLLDGRQIAAPPGQMSFTGPGGSLLELQNTGGAWTLFVDGSGVEQARSSPSGESPAAASEGSWVFFGMTTGIAHQMKVTDIGRRGQQVYVDGNLIPGPDGQTAFTGPGGVLLELKQLTVDDWALFVDGKSVEDHNTGVMSTSEAAAGGAEDSSRDVRLPVSSGTELPQGVSFDSSSGKYTSNIRVKGKFKCLGEFSTPEEAHTRYLEAKKALGDA